MTFNFAAFRSFVFWVAILGIFGNQLIFGISTVNEIDAHNQSELSRLDEHNKLIRDYRERKEQKEQGRSGNLGAAIANLGVDMALAFSPESNKIWTVEDIADDLWAPNYIRIFANPTFPFQYRDDWDLFNHIFAWGGLAAAFLWIILKVSIKPDLSDVTSERASTNSILALYKALTHKNFHEIKLTNSSTGEEAVVQRGRGIQAIRRVALFWFMPMFMMGYIGFGVIGVSCIFLIVLFEITLSDPRSLQVFLMAIYFSLGIVFALNIHKISLCHRLSNGWEISRDGEDQGI